MKTVNYSFCTSRTFVIRQVCLVRSFIPHKKLHKYKLYFIRGHFFYTFILFFFQGVMVDCAKPVVATILLYRPSFFAIVNVAAISDQGSPDRISFLVSPVHIS
jgi:hypothetical protein